eukprot:1155993-Pelagomonas_calceolata.AAC.10
MPITVPNFSSSAVATKLDAHSRAPTHRARHGRWWGCVGTPRACLPSPPPSLHAGCSHHVVNHSADESPPT